MHSFDLRSKRLSFKVLSYALKRMRKNTFLDHPESEATLRERVGQTITEDGIGGDRALQLWRNVLAPACISVDHPRFLSFVPGAPTEAAGMFDVAVSAANVYGGSWQEGAGAVFAENEALRWISGLARMPETSGGVFVSGGTAGNLSALIAARWEWRHQNNGTHDRTRGLVVVSSAAHSSIGQAARVMDVDLALVEVDHRGRMNAAAALVTIDALSLEDRNRIFAIVATGGTTNVGVVDDLAGIGNLAQKYDIWFHVDGAYGGAALCVESKRHLFDGIENADSFIVDPHKWLFAPFDSCALLYRDPRIARAAHTQHAEYLDVLHSKDEWNPSDYAHHLSRRPRGLPLWFSLATHGTKAYTKAVERTLDVTQVGAQIIREASHLELLLEPELSVIVFKRIGWESVDYASWSEKALMSGLAFVVPTSWKNEPCLRLCIVNPETTSDDIREIVESLS